MMVDTKRTTIVDIARQANVSASTVSRVLRQTPGVTSATKQAVLRAVADLDYRPNLFARSLASGRSLTIGVLTQNFGSPFYDGIMQGILLALEQTDYWPLFGDGRWQRHTEAQALQQLLDRRVDGLILIGGQLCESEIQAIAAKTPLIAVARRLHALPEQSIFVDNFQAGYRATRFLLDYGHQHIAHIMAPNNNSVVGDAQERFAGYRRALADAGVPYNPQLVVEGNLRQASGAAAVETLLKRGLHFDAIFAANDQMAFGARLALHQHGYQVPEEVSLVGFDDEASAAYMIPPLTTLHQPSLAMGRAAAHAVLNLINGQPCRQQRFSAVITMRETVARRN